MDIFFISIFGLVIGSFLNVCIYRVPRKLSVISPSRSYCPACNKSILLLDNIPILSWLFLGGKCRNCKNRISAIYPLVEILSLFFACQVYFKFGLSVSSIITYAFICVLLVITFIDFEFKLIPNVISFPGTIFGCLLAIYAEYTHSLSFPLTSGAIDSLLGIILGGGSFYLIALIYYFFTKQIGLGGGDIKLMSMTGAILGWHSIFPTVFYGSIFGSVVGIAVMLIKKSGRKTEIPFGPWLSLGTIIYIFTQYLDNFWRL